MTVGPYEPLAVATTSALALRARQASVEAGETGVAPESLWLADHDGLVWGIGPEEQPSGAGTLMRDLARTLGFSVRRQEGLADALLSGNVPSYDEAFLVSDEHGIVPASNAGGPRSERFSAGYAKLLDAAGERR